MIGDLIAACEWAPSALALFSANVFSPLIYYSHLTPVIVCVSFGLYLYLSGRSLLANRALLCAALLLSAWHVLDLVLWATESPQTVVFVWSIVNLIEPAIYASFVYFVIVSGRGRDVGVWTKLGIIAPLLPTILLASSSWNVVGFNLLNCDREVIEGPLAYYNYLVEIGYAVWIAALGLAARRDTKRKHRVSIILSVLVLLVGLSLGNIVGSFSENWTIGQFGLFVIPIAMGAISYFMVQDRFVDRGQIRAAQILVIGLWLGVASILLIPSIEVVRYVVFLTLAVLAFVGYLLVRSFRREFEQRKQIENLAAELRVSNDQLSEFMSLATHEIRNPATVIKGTASSLMEGDYGVMLPTVRDAVQKMYIRAGDILTLGTQYLNKSKLELNQLSYSYTSFDLAKLVSDLVREAQSAAEQKGIAVRLGSDHVASCPIVADQGKIKEVVGNLIDNAIKYTPVGSVETAVTSDTKTARVRITDTGVGIPAATVPYLFKKFSRADAQKVNLLGTGLGLFLAKTFVEAHRGRITVQSAGEGRGSTFIIELPLRQ